MANLNELIEKAQERAKQQSSEEPTCKEKDLKDKVKKKGQYSKFRVVSANEFISQKLPPREMLLAPWLPSQGLAMVYAPRGIGKTFFALEIAYAVASGGQFLKWSAPNPVPVLYLDGEMCAPDLQDRVKKIYARSGEIDSSHLRLVTPDLQRGAMPNLSDPESQKDLNPILEGGQVGHRRQHFDPLPGW